MVLTDLHASSETEDQVKGRLLLNVIVAQGATVLKLFTSKDQALLIWGNAFLVLNLGLDVVDGIARFDLKGDGLAGHCWMMLAVVTHKAAACRLSVGQSRSGVNLQVLTKICMMMRI